MRSAVPVVATIALLAVCGCRERTPDAPALSVADDGEGSPAAAPHATPPSPPSPPVAPPGAPPARAFELPPGAGASVPEGAGPTVRVTRDAIVVGEARLQLSSLEGRPPAPIGELETALRAWSRANRGERRLGDPRPIGLLLADGRVPAGTVERVVATFARSGFGAVAVGLGDADVPTVATLAFPRVELLAAPEGPAFGVELRVIWRENGLELQARRAESSGRVVRRTASAAPPGSTLGLTTDSGGCPVAPRDASGALDVSALAGVIDSLCKTVTAELRVLLIPAPGRAFREVGAALAAASAASSCRAEVGWARGASARAPVSCHGAVPAKSAGAHLGRDAP